MIAERGQNRREGLPKSINKSSLTPFPDKATLLVINGILIGSLWMIWPFQNREYVEVREKQCLIDLSPIFPEAFDSTTMNSLALMLGGLALVLLISYLGNRKK